YLLQSALINSFVGRAEHEQFILLVALGMVIVNGLLMIFGPDARPANLPYGLDSYEIGPLLIDKARLLAAGAALVVAALLFGFFRLTAIGTAIRACAAHDGAMARHAHARARARRPASRPAAGGAPVRRPLSALGPHPGLLFRLCG